MKENYDISAQTEGIALDPNQVCRTDKAITLRMLKLFLDTAKKCGKKIQASVKNNNWKALRTIAHKNIPVYCLMGLNELAGFLKYIEDNALDKDKHRSIEERVKTLNSKNTETIDAVRKYIGLIRTEEQLANADRYNYGI